MENIKKTIRVLIVDDSILFRETLAKFLSSEPSIEIVGKAGDPYEARDLIVKLRPDVLTLDVEMPKMNGIQFLRKLLPQYPVPVVIVSSAPIAAFDALDAGAVDYVRKAQFKSQAELKGFAEELIQKVMTASTAKVRQSRLETQKVSTAAAIPVPAKQVAAVGNSQYKVIAMGASTGGTDALQVVLTAMPTDCPPIVIVQHMPPVFTKMFAQRLNGICALQIKEAENGDRLQPGCVYLAPGDFHMELKKDSVGLFVRVHHGEKVSGHCPSVDVLFQSVAETAGASAIGVIMTGMGADGANGLLKMHEKGAYTIGQNKETCVVYGMPSVAYEKGACTIQAPLDVIAGMVTKQYRNAKRV